MNELQAERWRNRECLHCGASVRTRNAHARFCGATCRVAAHRQDVESRASRSLAEIVEVGDFSAFTRRLRRKVKVVESGCWIWQGRVDDGYPIWQFAGKGIRAHRLVLEMKHGSPLGTQAAHHICAVSTCVNPAHLQPVTHRDNVAEMLARRSYEARIEELEAALSVLAPSHEVLNRIAYRRMVS